MFDIAHQPLAFDFVFLPAKDIALYVYKVGRHGNGEDIIQESWQTNGDAWANNYAYRRRCHTKSKAQKNLWVKESLPHL